MERIITFLLEILMLISFFNFETKTVWETLLLGSMSLLIVILTTNMLHNE